MNAIPESRLAAEVCEGATGQDAGLNKVPVVDWKLAESRLPGGPTHIGRLAQSMQTECQKYLAEIRNGLQQNDASQLRRAAHTLKSSAELFAAERVYSIAYRLEKLGHAGDLEAATDLVCLLAQELGRLNEALENYG